METRQGVVSKVSGREWYDSRQGRNVVLHSFQIQGDRGWYRTGTKQEVNEGDFVQFVVGNNSAAKDIVKGPAPASAPAPARAAVSSGGGRDGYWEAKEARDIEREQRYQNVDIPRMVYQAAQERAVALLEIAIATEAVTLPAKKADKLDALINITHEISVDLAVRAMSAHEALRDGPVGADAVEEEEEMDE